MPSLQKHLSLEEQDNKCSFVVAMDASRMNDSDDESDSEEDSLPPSLTRQTSARFNEARQIFNDPSKMMSKYAEKRKKEKDLFNAKRKFRAAVRMVMTTNKVSNIISFNARMWQLAPDGQKRQPGTVAASGSLFLIADDKFEKTKVVQKRLERASIVMQRFFRRSLVTLRHFNEEKEYLEEELFETEQRRKDELENLEFMIQQEKKNFLLELEDEFNSNLSVEELAQYNKERDSLKLQITQVGEENRVLKKACKMLKKENKQLEIRDLQKEHDTAKLYQEVRSLEQDNSDWKAVADTIKRRMNDIESRVDYFNEKRREQKKRRKEIRKTMQKIGQFVAEELGEEHKIMRKLDKKWNKLVEAMEVIKLKATRPTDEKDLEQAVQELERQKSEPRLIRSDSGLVVLQIEEAPQPEDDEEEEEASAWGAMKDMAMEKEKKKSDKQKKKSLRKLSENKGTVPLPGCGALGMLAATCA